MMTRIAGIILMVFLCATLPVRAQEKSLEEVLRMNDDTNKVNSLNEVSYRIANTNVVLADSILDIGIELSKRLGFETGLARLYVNRALFFHRKKEYKTALEWFAKSREIFQRLGRIVGLHKVAHGEGNSYYRLGNYQKSDSLFNSTLKYAEQYHDTDVMTATLHSIALSYKDRAMFAEALKYVLRSASIREKKGDKKMLATDYGTIGSLLKTQKRYKESITYYKLGIELAEETGTKKTEETLYKNLGTVYKETGDYKNAMKSYRKAIAINSSISPTGLSELYQNISTLFHSMKSMDSAFFYARKSLKMSAEVNDERTMAINYYNMGEWMLESNDLVRSQQLLDSSNVLATKTDFKELLASIRELQANILAKKNNLNDAYAELQRSVAIKDSIYGIEMSKQLSELMTKYETEKKENEIEKLSSEKLLDAEKIARHKTLNYSLLAIAGLILISGFLVFRNVQKKRRAEKHVAILEKQNAIESMRSKIASDVHDDMGAGLTKMGLYSEQLLQSQSVTQKEREVLEKISHQSKEVINGMREIIWASNPANDNLKSMLGFMRQYIDRFFDGTNIRPVVNFPHSIGEISLHPEVRRNLFLILKESLNNAVKYSDTDKMDIEFTNENENFKLNIRDYGKGFEQGKKDSLRNGLTNMQWRAEQINALLKLVAAPGKGVQIAVEGKLY